MVAKLTRLTHNIAIQLQLVAESCTICSSRSRRSVRKLLDTLSYMVCVLCSVLSLWALRAMTYSGVLCNTVPVQRTRTADRFIHTSRFNVGAVLISLRVCEERKYQVSDGTH
jgi:choline-glycine betaine transporter